MTFYVYANPTSSEAQACAEELKRLLARSGCAVTEEAGGADILAAVGGDGTVLHAVRDFGSTHVPIWAINGGHLGYLTETEPADMEADLGRITAGQYRLENRLTMRGGIGPDGTQHAFFALNEAVIHRGGCLHSLHLLVEIDGRPVLRFAGDGVLVGTPTGSTAYNLSAGGPILMPEADHLVITPICAHSALSAPIVVPGSSDIAILLDAMPEEEGRQPQLVVDGSESTALRAGDVIRCRAGEQGVRFIRLKENSFYLRLQQRLSRRMQA